MSNKIMSNKIMSNNKKNILKNFSISFAFLSVLILSYLKADTILIDLSSHISIVPSTIEVSHTFPTEITIKNENTGSTTVDGNGAYIKYHLPSGSTYRQGDYSGSGWDCEDAVDSNGDLKCTYNESLTNGETSNTLVINLTAPSNIATDINASVTVTATTTDADNNNDTSSTLIEYGKSNLTISKTASKSLVGLNERYTYTITVSNPYNGSNPTVKARDVNISDTLPDGVSYIDGTLNDTSWCSVNSNTITCTGKDIDVDSSYSINFDVEATTDGTKTNTATAQTSSSDYNAPISSSVNVTVEPADIQLTKTLLEGLDANSAEVNSNIIYNISITNLKQTPAKDVNFTDTLPNGVTFVSLDDGGNWDCDTGQTITCTLSSASINKDEVYDVNITVKMPSTHQTITNTATAYTSTYESDTSNNSDTLTTQVIGSDLSISKTGNNATVGVGTNYTYTITVANKNGKATAKNIVVKDTLDSRMTYVSDTGNCSLSDNVLTCNHESLEGGSSYSFDVTVQMPTDSLDDVTNKATVSNDIDDEDSANNSVTVTTHLFGPDLDISKDANVSEVGLKKSFSYFLHITSNNSLDASDVNITDTLPPGVTITNIDSGGFDCPSTPITGTFSCTKSTFEGNSDATITLIATAPDTSGDIQNNVTISQSLNPNDGSSSKTVTVTGVTLNFLKTASNTAVTGGLIDYNLTVTNNSNSDAENLTITDNISNLGNGYKINQIIDSDGWDCSGTTTLTCTKDLLQAGGASSTIHFNVSVPNDAPIGTITNTAEVNTTTDPSPTVYSSARTTIQGADLVVVPPSITTAIANETSIYTLEIRNDGTATAKDVNVTNTFNTTNISNADFENIKIDCDNDGSYDVTSSPYICELGDMAGGTSKTIKISLMAPNYDSNFPGHSDIVNNTIVQSSTTDNNSANNNRNWPIEVHGADLVIYKTSNKAEVAVGGIVTFDIYVKNQWEANATNIHVSDHVVETDDGFSLITSSLNAGDGWSCDNITSSGFDCSYDKILTQGEETTHIIIDAQAPNSTTSIDQSRSNEANTSTDTAEQEIATTNDKIASVIIRGADLSITKSVSPSTVKLNESATYTITVTNNGLADANDTFVDDTLPDGFTNISTNGCNNDGDNISGQSVHCTLGDIAQNESKSFTITVNAPNKNGTYTNTAHTESSTPEIHTQDNNASVDLKVKGADLRIYKNAPERVAGYATFTYTVSLSNIGASTAYGAEINDTIPTNNGTTYVEGSLTTLDDDWSCNIDNGTIKCHTKDSNLSIPNGYSKNIFSFKVKAGPSHYWINNTVKTDTNTSESNYANNTYTTSTEVINIDLATRKLVNGHDGRFVQTYIDINGTITYKIQVANVSTVDLNITDVNVTDLIPSNSPSIVSITPNDRFDCNSPSNPGDKLICVMKDGENHPLQRSESWIDVATIQIKALDETQFDINDENNNYIINKYKAETTLEDQQPANNAPTSGDGYLQTKTLVRGANMSIRKTVSKNPVGAEESFYYLLSVKNWQRTYTSNQLDYPSTSAANIVVKDKLPEDVNFTSAGGSNWNCSEDSHIVTCVYDGIMPPSNSSSDIVIRVTAPNSNNEILSNEANVTTTTPELTRLLTDNQDEANTTTVGTNITISKTGPTIAGMGEKITYNIEVKNISQYADAKNVYIEDTLPNGATFDGDISNSHWSATTESNGTIKFTYDQILNKNSTSSFTFSSTLPLHTGTVRNHVEAFTSTVETSSPNVADWDTNITGANIVFAKNPTQTPNPVGALANHQYQIIIKNQGASIAHDVNVTFNFNDNNATPGWDDINGTGDNWSCLPYNTDTKQLICSLSNLDPYSNSSVLYINSTAPNYNGDIVNSVKVEGRDDENNVTGEIKNVTTTVKGCDIKVKKYAKDPNNPTDNTYKDDSLTMGTNKEVIFKISVSNDNIGFAKDVIVQDNFDSNFSDLNITSAANWDCQLSGQNLTCSTASISPNSSAEDIIISAKTPNFQTTLTNTAEANTSIVETDKTNNSDNITLILQSALLNPDFTASKVNVAMGETYQYILNLTNVGGNEAVDVNITDILPDGITFLDNNGSDDGWSCLSENQTVTCKNSKEIAAYNGKTTLILNVQAPLNNKGVFSNSATISSPSIENDITTNAPDVTVIGADLAVDLNATPIDALEDRNVTFNISIKDINISTAYNIQLEQTFSHNVNALYIKDSNGSNCSIGNSNQTVECTLDQLSYQQERNITIVATMPSTDEIIDPLISQVKVLTNTIQENTDNDIADINITVHPIMPVADYQFEECKWDGTEGEVKDSINNINGTSHNGAKTVNQILAQDSNHFSPKWRVGKFDGKNDYIEVPNDPKIQTTKDQTICAWVRPTDSDKSNIVDKGKRYGEGTITLEKSGKLTYHYGENEDNFESFSSNQELEKNKWSHICIVRDLQNKKLKWYIDGLKTNESPINIFNIAATNKPLYIADGYAGNFKGYIDEVELYNIALDDKAVQDIYLYEKDGKNYDGKDKNITSCAVDLQITKSVSPSPLVGAESNITYTINVKNLSDEPLTSGFTLQDIMPQGLDIQTFILPSDISCNGEYDFNCTFSSSNILYKNDNRTVQVIATAPNSTDETLENDANVSTGYGTEPGQIDSNLSNNSAKAVNKTIGTDLKITKTATFDGDDNSSNLIHFTITVKNISNITIARQIVVKDVYDERLTAITFPAADCTIPVSGHYFTCNLPDMKPGDEYTLTTTMSSEDGENIRNDVNVTSHTIDINLNNNTASVLVDVNTSGSTAPVKLKADFRKHVSINNYGNLVAIGNSILYPVGDYADKKLTDINTSYIDIDNNQNTYNSSSARLNIPENNITIEYAGLYWGGHIKGSDNNDTLTNIFNRVYFTTPSGNTYLITGGDQENGSILLDDNTTGFYRFKRFDNSIGRVYYACEANVTSILRNEYENFNTINGSYIVSDLNVSYGLDNTASFIPDDTQESGWSFFNSGFFGGWELVVIYKVDHRLYRSVRYKNSTLYDGYKVLMPRFPGQTVSLDINVSGFITPNTGDIESSLFSMVLAGDRELPYEQMSIDDASGNPHLVVEDTNNTNNIFNDTITLKNTDNTNIDKNLNLNYNPGVDLDQFDTTNYLSNSQTSTRINLQVKESDTETSPGSNQYPAQYAFVNMLAFNTQIYTPDFIDSYKECFKKKHPESLSNNDWVPCSDPTPTIHRGSIIKYRVTIINSGTDDALNVSVKDVLPKEVDFNGTCISETPDVNATYIFPMPDGVADYSNPLDLDNDYNSTLRTISGECYNALYDYNQSVREECISDLKAILIDGNNTIPLNSIPDGNGEEMNLIDSSYTGANCVHDDNKTILTFNFPTFAKKSVAWIEFYTRINEKAVLGESFQNYVSINFTNQTLYDAGINNLQTQESEPVDSGTVTFNWTHIAGAVQDLGRSSVGTKIVNKPFDLNVTLLGISSMDVDTSGNTTMTLSNLKLVDIYNNSSTTDISSSIVNNTIPISSTSINWLTHNTIYNKASREVGFSFDLTLTYGSYSETKHYPADFNSSTTYVGDIFSTRPDNFIITSVGGNIINGYQVIKAAQNYTMMVNAVDYNGNNSNYYNNVLSKTNNIKISLDNTFSTNPACINLNKLSIPNLSFNNGLATTSNTKYSEVGVIRFNIVDNNWTQKDQINGDCIANSGINSPSGLEGCNIEGNSSSIVFIPDHFDFINSSVNDFGPNYTFMVNDPTTDNVYGKLTTSVISKNADNIATNFFSNTCFADKVNVNLNFNVESKNLNDLNLSVVNESNITNLISINSLTTTGNNINTEAIKSNFNNGVNNLKIRLYMDRNKTTTLEPALIDMRNIRGYISNYLGINGVNVAPVPNNISTTNDLHFIYGRVHAPNYTSDTNNINVVIYYEGYCKDCNKTRFNMLTSESPDSVFWYNLSNKNILIDGNITNFVQPSNSKITISPNKTISISNGRENHTIIYNGTSYPYAEIVDINASPWLIYNPFDPNATVNSFTVEFTKFKDWAGIGNTGHTVDLNISSKGSNRIEW